MAEALSSVHTTSFPDLLNQAKASVVVSTYQAGKLILLRSAGSTLNTHFISLAKPMGVAYKKNRLSIGSGVRVIDYFNMPAVGPKVQPVNTHDSAFLPRRMHYTGDIDIHEMSFDAQNELWIINTKMSCLGTLDINHSFVPKWKPPFISGYDLTDRCHLNGLAMRDGKPRYVSSLGVSDKSAGWRENKAFGGMIMDIESNEFNSQGLSMPHSPRWYRNKLWVLESGAGQLITLDLQTGEKTVIAEVPGFCRGIDFIERYALIGLSQVRESSVFAGLPLTEREQDRKCGVWIVDIETGKTEGYIEFSEAIQEIFSVQVVPGSYPALLDLNDPLIASSYSLPDEAVKQFTPPKQEQLLFEKAIALHRSRQLADAEKVYLQAIKEQPKYIEAHYHLGTLYRELRQSRQAIQQYEKCLKLQPKHTNALLALGQLMSEQHDFDTATSHFNSAIATDKKFAPAYVNRAQINLKLENYKAGWSDLEWRWKMPNQNRLNCSQPKWSGEDISDKNLLIHTEIGDGSSLLLARFIKEARERCKRVIIVCPESLRLVFASIDGVDEARSNSNLSADLFDVYCPLLSLPWALGIEQSTTPDQPYINVPSQKLVQRIENSGSKKVGIVWSDKSEPTNSSCDLATMLELCTLEGIKFFSLQTQLNNEDKSQLDSANIVNLEAELVSYAHAADVIDQLDAVICVNSTIAHLSGAMGKPTVCLLSKQLDWCWGTHETQSNWYLNTQLVRKAADQSWNTVIEKAKETLERILSK